MTEQEICDLYTAGLSGIEIGKMCNRHRSDVTRIVKKNGYKVRSYTEARNNYTGVSINQDAFLNPLEEKSAYYYGLMLGDGSLLKNDRLTITLKQQDEKLLFDLSQYVGFGLKVKPKIINNKNYSVFTFTSKTIADRFRALGFTERKSTKEVCPDIYKYNVDFWRGLIDADGSIASGRKNFRLVGSESICKSYAEFCSYLSNNSNAVNVYKDGRANAYRADCKRAPGKIVLDALYENSTIHLERKYEQYKEFWI